MIDTIKLQNCLDALWGIIANISDQPEGHISFHDGIIWSQEGYKYDLWKRAHNIMYADELRSRSSVGSGRILKAMLETMTLGMESGRTNNLVDFRDVQGKFLDRALKNQFKAEEILFQIYQTEDDKSSFESAVKMWGDKYALISYFFFVKDCTKYAVMRPNNHAKRLPYLGISASCTASCTWANYQTYLGILNEVRDLLNNRLNDEITLIDAHSFVWMFWLFNENAVNPHKQQIEIPEDCDSYEIKKGGSGRRIEYLSHRYERNPDLRASAIKIHGTVCAACGFSFADVYGNLGNDFIEVHHVTPLSVAGGEINVSADTDLVCLCANCHRMIHRKKSSIMSVDELKEIIRAHRLSSLENDI